MEQSIKKSNIIIIVLVFLAIIGIIGIIFYINLKKQSTITVEATVTYIGNQYILVKDKEQEEYKLKTNQEYEIGDTISFTMNNLKKNSYPIEGTVEKIDTLSKTIQFTIVDSENNDTNEEENTNKEVNNRETNSSSLEKNTDEEIIDYFEKLNANLEVYSQDKSLSQNIKSGFVTVVDFLFYEGTIKDKTFSELSTSAKLKVLKLIFSIDENIEKYFPKYKEELSSIGGNVYTNVKEKALESYLDITTKACVENEETCIAAKEGLKELKSSFSITWSFIKNISGIGISKLKSWYEIWRTIS